jgi:tetratricopeptide (TPR) repeat protein
VYLSLGDHRRALECWEHLTRWAEHFGDKHSLSIALGNMAAVQVMLGQHQEGMKGIRARLKIAGELGDKKGLSLSYSHLAGIHSINRDYPRAIEAYGRAIGLAREVGLKYYLTMYLQEAGEAHFELGEYQEAGELCRESLEISRAISRQDAIFKCRLLQAKLAAVKDRAEGVRLIRELLAGSGQPDQQAVINYELFKLTQDGQCRKAALELYARLYEKTPDIDHKRKMEELERSN